MFLSWGKHLLSIPYSLLLGIRFFDDENESTDATESAALVHKLEIIGIYSNSWGPDDSAWIIEGPGPLTSAALEKGIKEVSYRVIRAFTIE